jgi:uncharacterized protein
VLDSSLRIDAFPHIFPKPFFERLEHLQPAFTGSPNVASRRSLFDLDERFRMMDRYPGYVQVLTLSLPTIEDIARGQAGADLAQLANDGMADLVRRYPDRFLGFGAAVSLDDVDSALKEIDRAVNDLGALGVQIFTNVLGHPLDEPRFEPLFAKMAELGKTIWIHPTRNEDHPDYPSETASKYALYFKLGWPYETSVCISRLIFSGIVDRYLGLRFLTHHAGGIVPHLAGRLTLRHESPAQRKGIAVGDEFTPEHTLELYKRFYGDTVFSGAHHPLECALEFYGTDHILFGTDMPYGPEGGEAFIRETMAAIEELRVSEAERHALWQGNAREILGL